MSCYKMAFARIAETQSDPSESSDSLTLKSIKFRDVLSRLSPCGHRMFSVLRAQRLKLISYPGLVDYSILDYRRGEHRVSACSSGSFWECCRVHPDRPGYCFASLRRSGVCFQGVQRNADAPSQASLSARVRIGGLRPCLRSALKGQRVCVPRSTSPPSCFADVNLPRSQSARKRFDLWKTDDNVVMCA